MTASIINNTGFSHESPVNETVEWYTPPSIFTALGLTYDLDPCSAGAGNDYVPATNRYTIGDNGLAQPWFGSVFMNPPYGPSTPIWLERLATHGRGIGLVFARTDTAWFHDSAATADTICFMRGRIKFIDGRTGKPGGSPGSGSMLLAWGAKESAALLASGLGTYMSKVR